jgi:hypothetical protein
LPIDSGPSAAAANSGARAVQLRFVDDDLGGGPPLTFQFYQHHTLHGVRQCPHPFSNDELFTQALLRIPETERFAAAMHLRNPFIRGKFEPPTAAVSQPFNAFGVNMRHFDGTMQVMSLRKRFQMNGAGTLLLVVRTYASKRGGGHCDTLGLRFNDTLGGGQGTYHEAHCDAVVLNQAGQGACLTYGGGNALGFARSINSPSLVPAGLASGIDHFMWRRLLQQQEKPNAPEWDELAFTHFSPKCADSQNCEEPGRIYLPDLDFFFP